MSANPVQLQAIRFAYAGHPVLDGVSLHIAAGEIYGLVGPDGAGKSTLLRIAAGQLTAEDGEVRLLGRRFDEDPLLRARIAYMPQGFGLYPDLSVQENLAFFADLHDLAPAVTARKMADLLARTDLQAFTDRRAGQLSGGMMQKLALACALISDPKIMFLDEPTTGVDPLSRRAFWQLLSRVRAEGVAILYATANLDEAERCDRVGMLEGGRIRREGPPPALARIEGEREWRIEGPDVRRRIADLRRLPGVRWVFPRGRVAVVWADATVAAATLSEHLQALDPRLTLQPVYPNLQEAVLRRLAEEATAHG